MILVPYSSVEHDTLSANSQVFKMLKSEFLYCNHDNIDVDHTSLSKASNLHVFIDIFIKGLYVIDVYYNLCAMLVTSE